MASYLKLGDKAESFFDPISRLGITKGQVIEIEKIPQTKKVIKALKHGHLEKTTQEEYVKAKKEPVVPETPAQDEAPFNKEPDQVYLESLKKDQLIDWAKKFGFDDSDMEELQDMKKSEMIEFILETYPNYTSEE